jgi:hypothetical protein
MPSITLSNGHTRQAITPEVFGNCVFNWSKDAAMISLKALDTGVFRESALAKAFCKKPFGAHSQFTVINMAAYTLYASEFLRTPKDVQDRLFDGLIKELSTLQVGNGVPLHEAHIRHLQQSFVDYVNANIEDLVASRTEDPNIYKPDISPVAKKFFERLPPVYPDLSSIAEVDRMLLGHYVADMPFSLYKALSTANLITYE